MKKIIIILIVLYILYGVYNIVTYNLVFIIHYSRMLPWVELMLASVKKEYSKPHPQYSMKEVSNEDMRYIHHIVKDSSPFDELKLKHQLLTDLKNNRTGIWKSYSPLGEIIYIGDKERVNLPVWWRCIRLLSKRPVKIVIFSHPSLRMMPEPGRPVKAQHINGGYASKCDGRSIVIYRKEELTRVLIHELLHASCSDPYHMDTSDVESNTEAWAEMIQCAMIAEGKMDKWKACMRRQIEYSLRQSATLRDNHRVLSKADYAWRYTTGKFDIWKGLGLNIPDLPKKYEPITSLRLSIEEPLY